MQAGVLLAQALNGVQLGLLLFLVAAGLTLVFGVMDFINLAHGVQYMLGAYLGASFAAWTGSFWIALLLVLPATGLFGFLLDRLVFRHFYARDHLAQVLATFGVILTVGEGVRMLWGTAPLQVAVPAWLEGGFTILPGLRYPWYRVAVVGASLACAAGLWWLIERTRAGMLVRAGASNAPMVSALGVDVGRLFAGVVGVGAMLAGFAGMLAAPLLSVEPGMGDTVLILAFAAIVVGGAGSVRGAFAGSMLIGVVDTLGRAAVPDLMRLAFAPSTARQVGAAIASMLAYAAMAVVLAVRPAGLLPQRGARRV